MSAQDNLNPQQFYHGSPNDFSGQVEPTDQGHFARRAYFTNDYDTAKAYAEPRAGSHTGYVYKVSPQGDAQQDEYEKGAYKSDQPLTITGKDKLHFPDGSI